MAVPSFGQITGEDIPQLINSLEKQRKELEFILSSLDATNILEISADLINSGTLGAEFVDLATINAEIDNLQERMVTVESGSTGSKNDVNALKNRMTTAETDINAVEVRMTTAETDINAVEVRMTTAETDINAVEVRMTTAETNIAAIPQQIEDSRIIDVLTSDPVNPVAGKMWLRSDL